MFFITKFSAVTLHLKGKTRIIRLENSDFGFDLSAKNLIPDPLQFFTHLLDLVITTACPPIMLEQPVPVLFRSKTSCAPPQKHNSTPATPHTFIPPTPQDTRPSRTTQRLPTTGPSLLFHHPEVFALQACHP